LTEALRRLTDPGYLRLQYGDDERIGIRIATHERYSENAQRFVPWVVERVGARPGDSLLDVGSGPGQYHGLFPGVRIVAVDISPGMLAKVRVERVQADAQVLPFRDGAFDRVMANHVLYHLADVSLALRELRRVLRPRGRAVIATNASDTLEPLVDLYNEVAREVGVAEDDLAGARFSFDDAPLVRQVFPDARIELFRDAFVFRQVEPVIAYVASGAPTALPETQRADLLRRLEARVRAIIEREGVFRVPKTAGCFVAER